MKTIKALLSIAVVAALTVFSSCGGGDDDPGLSLDEKLNGTWALSSVTVDNADVTGDFGGFQLSLSYSGPDFGGGNYNITNANNILYSSGGYTLNGTTGMNLNGGDGSYVSVQIALSNDDKTLTFSFYNPTTNFGGGRTAVLEGNYEFVLNKN